jgi:hypothetical protein
MNNFEENNQDLELGTDEQEELSDEGCGDYN